MKNHHMPRKYAAVFALLTLLLFFTNCHAGNDSKALIWQIQSDTATVFILGSMHFADDNLYPLNQTIEKSFEACQNLVLEIDPLAVDQQAVQSYIQKRGYYQGAESVVDHTTPEVFHLLESYVNHNALPAATIYKMKPGMIALTLSSMQLERLGYSPDKGIDIYFARKAKEAAKPITSLETLNDQLDMLFTMPNENSFLQYTLIDLENLESFMNDIVAAWKSGDAPAMHELLLAPYEGVADYQPFIRKIFYNRNLRMASKIRKFLKSDQTWFVVVGAGHLLGDKGLISLLDKKSYTITQLDNEKE